MEAIKRLNERMPELQEEARKRAERDEATKQKTADVRVVEFLPRWASEQRGAPNAILRSALFGVIRRGRRAYVEKMEIPAQVGIRLIYTGTRLDQASFSVWLYLVQIAIEQASLRIEFSMYEVLKQIGKSTGKANYEWLDREITRLRGGTIELSSGGMTYGGGLVHDYFKDENNGRYVVVLNEKLMPFFGRSNYTLLEIRQRTALKSDLSQWLHAFYSTHDRPYPMKTQTLRGLCGSETGELWKFRQQLKMALVELIEVTGWNCRIDDKTDLCHVEKLKMITV